METSCFASSHTLWMLKVTMMMMMMMMVVVVKS
jgi:hypothetical protein